MEPKIILKIELLDNFEIKITLMEMHDVFGKKMVHNYTTRDGWRFTMGNKFQAYEKLTILPEKPNKDVFTIKAINDGDRYFYLRSMNKAFMTLSDKYAGDDYSEKSHTKFQGNMWLIF